MKRNTELLDTIAEKISQKVPCSKWNGYELHVGEHKQLRVVFNGAYVRVKRNSSSKSVNANRYRCDGENVIDQVVKKAIRFSREEDKKYKEKQAVKQQRETDRRNWFEEIETEAPEIFGQIFPRSYGSPYWLTQKGEKLSVNKDNTVLVRVPVSVLQQVLKLVGDEILECPPE